MLRYFNPVGSHPSGLIGDDPSGIPNNLMPYVTQVASGQRAVLDIFGSDYATPDGNGVRDYIHVQDLRNLCKTPCGLRSAGLGRANALTFSPIAVLLASKFAFLPIPIRLPQIHKGFCRGSLAQGHVAAVRTLLEGAKSLTVNLGTGQGYSVLEVVRAFEAATGQSVPYRMAARRPGGIAAYYADPSKAAQLLGWKAQHSLAEMCADA